MNAYGNQRRLHMTAAVTAFLAFCLIAISTLSRSKTPNVSSRWFMDEAVPINGVQETVNYGFLIALAPDQYCIDFDTWCNGVKANFTSLISERPQDVAFNFVNGNALCEVARDLLNQTTAFIVVTGSFNVTYDEFTQEVNRIDFYNDVNHASLGVTEAAAIADPVSLSEGMNVAFASTDDLCLFLNDTGSATEILCGFGAGGGEIGGNASAFGTATGSARSRAGHLQNQNAKVHVTGQNIKRFSSDVSTTIESFVFSDVKSTVDALSQSYLTAFSTAYTKTCYRFVERNCESQCRNETINTVLNYEECVDTFCLAENCNQAQAEENLNVSAIGESFGETVGLSFDQITFDLTARVNFEHRKGRSIQDQVTFGYDGIGFSEDDSSVTCLSGRNNDMRGRMPDMDRKSSMGSSQSQSKSMKDKRKRNRRRRTTKITI